MQQRVTVQKSEISFKALFSAHIAGNEIKVNGKNNEH